MTVARPSPGRRPQTERPANVAAIGIGDGSRGWPRDRQDPPLLPVCADAEASDPGMYVDVVLP